MTNVGTDLVSKHVVTRGPSWAHPWEEEHLFLSDSIMKDYFCIFSVVARDLLKQKTHFILWGLHYEVAGKKKTHFLKIVMITNYSGSPLILPHVFGRRTFPVGIYKAPGFLDILTCECGGGSGLLSRWEVD